MAKRILIGVVFVVIVVNVVLLLLVMSGGRSGPRAPLPNPNGYDDFVQAGRLLKGPVADYAKLGREELTSLVAGNKAALDLARAGLAKESRVPIAYSQSDVTEAAPSMTSLKQLALMFAAEGMLEELAGRSSNAARIYLAGMRVGQESSRGGILITRLVGLACEAIPARRLDSLATSLDAPACRDVVRELEMLDAKEEPLEKTMENEKKWCREAYGIRGQIELLLASKQLKATEQGTTSKFQANTLHRRQMMTAFAAQAYELEKGKRVQAWSDLVPAYLKAVPKEPTTGKDVVYVP